MKKQKVVLVSDLTRKKVEAPKPSVVQSGVHHELVYLSAIEIDQPPSAIAVNYLYLCLGCGEGRVAIWKVNDDQSSCIVSSQPILMLNDHKRQVTSIALGNTPPNTSFKLCTASNDKIILWNIQKLVESGGIEKTGIEIGSNLDVQAVAFSADDNTLCVCSGCDVVIYDIMRGATTLRLEGHKAIVNRAIFSSDQRLYSISDDRTFKIWNLEARNIEYNSTILSAYPLVSIAAIEHKNVHLVLGSTDGVIRFYETISEPTLMIRCIYTMDLNKLKLQKKSLENPLSEPKIEVLSSDPIWKRESIVLPEIRAPQIVASEVSQSILAMRFFKSKHNDSYYTFLVVGTSKCVVIINVPSYEIVCAYDIQSFIGEYAQDIVFNIMEEDINCLISGQFQPYLYIARLNLSELLYREYFATQDAENQQNSLSVLWNGTLPPKLEKEYIPNQTFKNPKDKPVTFHSRIKSSGYTSTPWTSKQKKKPKSVSVQKTPSVVQEVESPPVFMVKGADKIHNGAIMKISFSPDASKIASSSSDGHIRILKLPLSKHEGEGITLSGHKNAVLDVRWSNNQKYLISSAIDSSAIIWGSGQCDPLFHMTSIYSNTSKQSIASSSTLKPVLVSKTAKVDSGTKDLGCFKSAIKNPQFFFKDKFIVLGYSNGLYLYNYYVHKLEKDEKLLNKQLNPHKYKLLQNYKLDTSSINCISSANSFKSNLIFIGASNKSLSVYDVVTNQVVTSYENAHDRVIHTISLNEHPNNQADSNLILSAATDSCIKMWDIRTSKCIRKFAQHKNSIHTITCQISPCSKWLVTGSEDRNIYMYDVLSGSLLHKLQGCHSDVISGAQFVPRRSDMMASCSFDGRVNLYKNRIY